MTYRRADVLTDGGTWLAVWVPEDAGRGDRWAQCRSLDFEKEVDIRAPHIAATEWHDERREDEETEPEQDARRRDNDLREAYQIGYKDAFFGNVPSPEKAVRRLR